MGMRTYGCPYDGFFISQKKHTYEAFYSTTMKNVQIESQLSNTAKKVFEKRYLARDENGNITETISERFATVAEFIASADEKYVGKQRADQTEQTFYEMLTNFEFISGMSLYNAGKKYPLMSACFVLPIEDSMNSIFKTLKDMASVTKYAGGVGYDFSHIRPKGDRVGSTGRVASGPLSFMRLYDFAVNIVLQEASRRRPANMGILRVDHPDILDFIKIKKDFSELTSFNISVAATEKFMNAVKEDREYDLFHTNTKRSVRKLRARDVFDRICEGAWASAEPGMVFIDEVNRFNPTPKLGKMEATNPCGEQPLFAYEACNLGSVVLSKMMKTDKNGKTVVDWDKLRTTVHNAVHYLDNTIDVSYYPVEEIREMSHNNRRIGLGIMGFADLLIHLGISYASDEGVATAEKIMKFVNEASREKSAMLANERGSFPNFEGSIWQDRGYAAMRNCAITTIAPTGSTSIVANTSSGCEPIFALVYVRKNILDRSSTDEFIEVNPLFEKALKERWLYSKELMEKVAEHGSVQDVDEIPQELRKLFVTANDMSGDWHVKIQAAFQKHTDNGVSKTINMPSTATVQDVENAYMLAYDLKCKGVTVYRDASRDKQVLNLTSTQPKPHV